MTSTVECACACLTAAATFVRGEWTGAPDCYRGWEDILPTRRGLGSAGRKTIVGRLWV